MDFLFVPYIEQVPEWREIFQQHQLLLTNFITLMNQTSQLKQSIAKREVQKSTGNIPTHQHQHQQLLQKVEQIFGNQYVEMNNHCDDEENLISVFVWYKIYQISAKYQQYSSLMKIIGRNQMNIEILFENLYIQAYYLDTTISFNFAKYKSVIKKLNKNITDVYEEFRLVSRMKKIKWEVRKLLATVQLTFINRDMEIKQKFQGAFEKKQKQSKVKLKQSEIFGILMGFIFGFLAITIMVIVINGISLERYSVFYDDFPAWRGSAQLAFYLWILSLDMLFYENSNINYKLIFYFEHYNLPSSSKFFLMASIFTFVWLLLLLLQTLEFAGVIHTGFNSYPELFWLIFLAFMFNPLPILHSKGRFYVIRLFFKSIFPFFVPMNFLIIWFSEQMVSLTQPTTDFFFTCCYFFSKDLHNCKLITANFNSGIVITIFCLRMYQNIKIFIQQTNQKPDKKYDYWSLPFLGFWRGLFGALAATIAIFYRLKVFDGAFALWLVFISISTLVSWYVDIRGDWGLFIHQKKTVLRQKLLFPEFKSLYLFMIVFDLFLRVGWVFTIAPFVINSRGIWPLLFVMIFSFIQIFRRGVWNVFRVENQHIKNCEIFQATVKDHHVLQKAREKAQKVLQKKKSIRNGNAVDSSHGIIVEDPLKLEQKIMEQKLKKLAQVREKKQLQELKQNLKLRKKKKKGYHQFIQKMKQQLHIIKKNLHKNNQQ